MMQRLGVSQDTSPYGRIETVVLYFIFSLTGATVVLPGTLMPFLSRHWGLGDGATGLLFLCLSVGSSLGSLFARGRLARALCAGCVLVAAGSFLLSAHGVGAPVVAALVYGFGLGLTMTSISLLRSRRRAGRRIAELARLNLIWACGAGAGPAILLRSAARFDTALVLRAVASLFCVLAVVVLLVVSNVQQERQISGGWLHAIRAVPVVLLCLIPLATGVESGISSWLSSYITRGGFLLSVTISATTAFGIGLIVSRILYSHPGAAGSTRLVLLLHPALIVLGIVMLMMSRSPVLSVAAAFLTGLGVGPMYPLVLALLLNYSEAGNAGFLAGGIGASVLPMITGAVSGWTHSLRTGLGVLLMAGCMMLTLAAQLARRAPVADGA